MLKWSENEQEQGSGATAYTRRYDIPCAIRSADLHESVGRLRAPKHEQLDSAVTRAVHLSCSAAALYVIGNEMLISHRKNLFTL